MFQKRLGFLAADNESTNTSVHFLWSGPGMPSHGVEVMAYEHCGIRYLLDCESVWEPGGLSRKQKLCAIRVSLDSLRQQQVAGPTVPQVGPELRDQITTDLRAAAVAIGINCEFMK